MANNAITKTAKFNLNTIGRDQTDVKFIELRDLELGTRADSNAQILDSELYKLLKRGLFVGYTTMPTTNNFRIDNSAITEMFDKIVLLLIPNTDNTGITTLQINNFTASSLKKISNNAYIDIVAGDLKSKQPTLVYYDLTANVFVLASALVQSGSTTQSGIVQLSNDTNSTDETKAVTPHALKIIADSRINTNLIGVANGVASTDANGKVSLTQIPDAILGSLKYISTWDASGGTTPPSPSNGNYWIISDAGVINTVTYNVRDWLIYNNSTWSKLDGEDITIANNLTETVTGKALDATQGKILADKIGILKTATLIFENKTVATTDFVADTTYADYPYKVVISCTGVTADYFGDVTFNTEDAISDNYAPVCLTGTDTVTIYAAEIPNTDITIPTIKCIKAVNI